ncbi:enhanced entry protein EnhB [Legionella birminghamensis]|uniref:Enhanced entry protein EnhB n=1 Tax=Legionella birminghamensis TaxID=28083 RepID=A0A378IDJ4_9GAMM|nr:hypothetical protein [Legionella birminghamensis]KTC74281.1 enhanced entry protein EnhB [Legionella birminghamensis]STX32601.1 enhanced entry protein EnhB [Legionella birminghamensis]
MRTINTGKTLLLASVLLASMQASYAEKVEKEDNRNPLGCRDTGYLFELKTLKLLPEEAGAVQSMYFLFNKSNQKVSLYQMLNKESSRSMYLNHSIQNGQWAVLSTSEKQMKYICTIPQQGSRYGQIVDCADHLQVCEYTNVKFGLNNKGNYWLVNGNTRSGALRDVVRYGIIPAL